VTEKPNKPELDTLLAALWRAVAKTLAQPMTAAERARVLATAETVEEQLRLTHTLWKGE